MRWKPVLVSMLFAICLSTCATGPHRVEPKLDESFRLANKTTPHFAKPPQGNRRVIVFVHGVFGDALDTWRNSQGKYFFDLFDDDEVFQGSDIFVYGFPSQFFGGGFSIEQAAVNMEQWLRDAGVFNYDQIIFVAHSMGGLVTERMLILFSKYASKVPLLFFFSTPQEGAAIASLADVLLRNSALKDMIPGDHNSYLTALDNDWKQRQLDQDFATAIRCAYETKDTFGVRIVPVTSATRFCVGASAPAFADHIEIAKPDSRTSDSYIALRNAVRDVPRPLPPPVEIIEVALSMEPIGDVPSTVVETFHVDDSSNDCRINRNRSQRYVLKNSESIKEIGTPVVLSSSCPNGASYPIPGSVRMLDSKTVEVDYHLQACGEARVGGGMKNEGDTVCRGLARLAFDLPITATKYIRSTLPRFDHTAGDVAAGASPIEFIYPHAIPATTRNLEWRYQVTVARIVRRGEQTLSKYLFALSQEHPSAGAFISSVEDGKLTIRWE